jgi:hypothetical protein
MNEVKSDYQSKENDFKTQKVKIKEVQEGIEALKTEYREAQESLNTILVKFDVDIKKLVDNS